ncbi:MAG: hypothetical protein NVV83_25690, partial [Afipia sp.]|nr:hypothetical protein [Afipia sp.]
LTLSGSIIIGSALDALLTVSSEQIARRLHSHADVRANTWPYHRNNRGPNIAPAKVHSASAPYQTAINGNESSVQEGNKHDATHAARNEAGDGTCPGQILGAALRTAQMVEANGTIAMIGIVEKAFAIDPRRLLHPNASAARIRWPVAASNAITMNGIATTIDEVFAPRRVGPAL